MSRASLFLNSTKQGQAAAPATKPGGLPPGTNQELVLARLCQSEERLYKELLAALGRRGLASIHLPCEHCKGLSTVSIMRYPEVQMACRDAVAAWSKAFAESLPQ